MSYRHWRRKRWLPAELISGREAATRGRTTKEIRRLRQFRDLYRRQGYDAEIDHIRPISMGGKEVYENMWIILKKMNTPGPQRRTELEIWCALKAAQQDRLKLYETWPNSQY